MHIHLEWVLGCFLGTLHFLAGWDDHAGRLLVLGGIGLELCRATVAAEEVSLALEVSVHLVLGCLSNIYRLGAHYCALDGGWGLGRGDLRASSRSNAENGNRKKAESNNFLHSVHQMDYWPSQ